MKPLGAAAGRKFRLLHGRHGCYYWTGSEPVEQHCGLLRLQGCPEFHFHAVVVFLKVDEGIHHRRPGREFIIVGCSAPWRRLSRIAFGSKENISVITQIGLPLNSAR